MGALRIPSTWLLACVLAICVALGGTAGAQGFAPVPRLEAPVMDTIGLLDTGQRASLDNVLKDYEARTGNQIAVLLVGSTAPEAIEQFSIRVADAWKLGRKGIDDGVILVVAKDNPKALRRLRIEAGRGVQGVLTDAQSKRILEDVIAPHFRQNDYYGGLVAGTSAIMNLLEQEHFAPPSGKRAAVAQEAGIGNILPFVIFFAVVIFALSRGLRGGRRLRPPGDNGWGRMATGIILGNALGRSHGGLGGFGGGVGDFGGGGSGGGGFSGGGGGFDGGGASGDW
jgi:uncharacterized protein